MSAQQECMRVIEIIGSRINLLHQPHMFLLGSDRVFKPGPSPQARLRLYRGCSALHPLRQLFPLGRSELCDSRLQRLAQQLRFVLDIAAHVIQYISTTFVTFVTFASSASSAVKGFGSGFATL